MTKCGFVLQTTIRVMLRLWGDRGRCPWLFTEYIMHNETIDELEQDLRGTLIKRDDTIYD